MKCLQRLGRSLAEQAWLCCAWLLLAGCRCGAQVERSQGQGHTLLGSRTHLPHTGRRVPSRHIQVTMGPAFAARPWGPRTTGVGQRLWAFRTVRMARRSLPCCAPPAAPCAWHFRSWFGDCSAWLTPKQKKPLSFRHSGASFVLAMACATIPFLAAGWYKVNRSRDMQSAAL